MSTVINYQLRAHMSLLAHIDTDSPLPHLEQRQPTQTTVSRGPDSDDFWSPPDSPTAVEDGLVNGTLTRVTTDICISLKKPSPDLEQDSEEFKRQAKEIKKDIQRISKYSNRHARKRSDSPSLQEEGMRRTTERLRYEHEFRRQVSVNEGREFLLDFLRYHFAEHMDKITIISTKTLEEVKMIGNEELSIGVRQCRRLFNAPVISDQVGLLLWQELSQPDALDHGHDFHTDDEAERGDAPPEIIRRRRTEELEGCMAAYVAERRKADGCSNVLQHSQTHNTPPSQPTKAKTGRIRSQSTPIGMAEAMSLVTEQAATSIPMEKKAIDGFLEGVKKSAVRGATQLAASLASGYA